MFSTVFVAIIIRFDQRFTVDGFELVEFEDEIDLLGKFLHEFSEKGWVNLAWDGRPYVIS